MPVIPAGYCQVNWVFTGNNVPSGAQCTWGLGPVGASTPVEVAELMADAWDIRWQPLISNDVTLASVSCKFGPSQTGPSAEFAAGVTGTIVADSPPPNVAYLIHKVTADGGRAGRGRVYHPGVQESVVNDSGALTQSLIDAFNAMLTGFRDDVAAAMLALTGLTSGLVLLHGAGAPISTPSPITSLTIDSRVATQRRRLRR